MSRLEIIQQMEETLSRSLDEEMFKKKKQKKTSS